MSCFNSLELVVRLKNRSSASFMSFEPEIFPERRRSMKRPSSTRLSISTAMTDTSADEEWEELQQQINKNRKLARETDESVLATLKEDDLLENQQKLEAWKQEIELKAQECDEMKERVEDLKDRFVWDLSLAMKRCLVEELGPLNGNAVKLSTVRIHDIMDQMPLDHPQPHEWNSWIENQYVQAL